MPIDPKKRGMASADPEVRRRAGAKGGSTPTKKPKGFASPLHPRNRRNHG